MQPWPCTPLSASWIQFVSHHSTYVILAGLLCSLLPSFSFLLQPLYRSLQPFSSPSNNNLIAILIIQRYGTSVSILLTQGPNHQGEWDQAGLVFRSIISRRQLLGRVSPLSPIVTGSVSPSRGPGLTIQSRVPTDVGLVDHTDQP